MTLKILFIFLFHVLINQAVDLQRLYLITIYFFVGHIQRLSQSLVISIKLSIIFLH
jgi:hypothetical protein